MLWRLSKPARAKRRAPGGFVLPAQPTLCPLAPSGPGWIHELKHDGWRLIARKEGGTVRLWTRQANDVTAWFTGIADAVAALPVERAVIDGEAMVHRPDGHSDFHALRSKRGAASAMLIAFDLIEHERTDLRRVIVEERRRLLATLTDQHPCLTFSAEIEGDGPTIFEHACRLGAEGIISKRRGSTYRSGRVDSWRKTKFKGYERR